MKEGNIKKTLLLLPLSVSSKPRTQFSFPSLLTKKGRKNWGRLWCCCSSFALHLWPFLQVQSRSRLAENKGTGFFSKIGKRRNIKAVNHPGKKQKQGTNQRSEGNKMAYFHAVLLFFPLTVLFFWQSSVNSFQPMTEDGNTKGEGEEGGQGGEQKGNSRSDRKRLVWVGWGSPPSSRYAKRTRKGKGEQNERERGRGNQTVCRGGNETKWGRAALTWARYRRTHHCWQRERCPWALRSKRFSANKEKKKLRIQSPGTYDKPFLFSANRITNKFTQRKGKKRKKNEEEEEMKTFKRKKKGQSLPTSPRMCLGGKQARVKKQDREQRFEIHKGESRNTRGKELDRVERIN